MAQHEHTDDGGVHVHIHSWKLYTGILVTLLILTVVTVAVSYVDVDTLLTFGRGPAEGVGAWNLAIAIIIAVMKASLVVTFFMHLKDDKRFNALVFLGSIMFIGVFIAYTMNDTELRGEVGDVFNGVHVDPHTGERAPGGIEAPLPGLRAEEGLEQPEAAEEATEEAADEEAAAEDEGSEEAVNDIVEDILGEEEAEEAAAAPEGEGDDFIDDILDEEAAEEAAADEGAAAVEAVREVRPADDAEAQPEAEPEPEAAE